METKVCSKCKKKKSISEFSKDKHRKDGLTYWCKQCFKKYYQKNKKRFLEKRRKYREKNLIWYWCYHTIYDHKKRGFKVLFGYEKLLPIAKQTTHCPICNTKLKWEVGKLKSNSPSLDRINNEEILTLENTWIICKKCNRIKNNLTMKEFINYCENVIKKFGKLIIIPNNVKIIGNTEDIEYQTTDPIVVMTSGREWDNILRKEK